MSHQTIGNLLALTTMVCWGVSNGFIKIPTLRLGSAKAIRLRQFVMIFALIFYQISFGTFYIENKDWALISFFLGVIGYLPFYFFCEALRIGSIGVINAIANSFPVVSAILVYLIFETKIPPIAILGIIITSTGIILLSLNRNTKNKKSKEAKDKTKAIFFACIACLMWGAYYTYIPIPNQYLEVVIFTFLLQLGTLFSSHLHSIAQKQTRNIDKKCLSFGIASGLIGITGSLCFYKALHLGNPGVVTAIAGSSPFVGAIFGHLVYHEKTSKLENLGIMITIIGVILLSCAK